VYFSQNKLKKKKNCQWDWSRSLKNFSLMVNVCIIFLGKKNTKSVYVVTGICNKLNGNVFKATFDMQK
jgi:hypothetical protein